MLPLYGIYSGFELCENVPVREGSEEYLDSEKYQIRPRDYCAPGNINADIERLNAVRREHRALQQYANLSFHASENPTILFYRKAARAPVVQWPGQEPVVVPPKIATQLARAWRIDETAGSTATFWSPSTPIRSTCKRAWSTCRSRTWGSTTTSRMSCTIC